jgi:cytochrome c551/c552
MTDNVLIARGAALPPLAPDPACPPRPPLREHALLRRLLLLCVCCVPAVAAGRLGAAEPAPPPPPKKPTFDDISPILAKHCVGCHGEKRSRAGLNLEKFKDQESVLKNLKVWEKVANAVRAGEMPPPAKPRPSAAELDTLTAWLDGDVLKVDCTTGKRDPGRVTIHRLNRAEYDNTIRDLVGVAFHPADDFPADDVGYGFDNIGDVLSMPPILMEKYLTAAEKVVDAAWKSDEARNRILIAEPKDRKEWNDCARKIFRNFADRAYRRPATDEEVKRLARFVEAADKNGDSFETGVQLGVQAVLASPHFLFRVEIDKEPNNPDAVHALTDWELATRLSYFLWSSMPDDQLFDLARKGELHKPDVLEVQARRMLKDPKAHALVENFADQWLTLRNLKTAAARRAAAQGGAGVGHGPAARALAATPGQRLVRRLPREDGPARLRLREFRRGRRLACEGRKVYH